MKLRGLHILLLGLICAAAAWAQPARSRASAPRASAPAPRASAPVATSSGGGSYSSNTTPMRSRSYGGFGRGMSMPTAPTAPPTTRIEPATGGGGVNAPVRVDRFCPTGVSTMGYVSLNQNFFFNQSWLYGANQFCRLGFFAPGFMPYYVPITSRYMLMPSRIQLTSSENVRLDPVSVTSYTAPKEARKAFEKGVKRLFGAQKDTAGAKEALLEAVELHPKYAEAWTMLGHVYLRLQNRQQAEYAFERSIEADPQYGAPYAPLSRMLVKQGKWARALEVADKGVSLNPSDSQLKYDLVTSAFAADDKDTAYRWAQQLYEQGDSDYFPAVIYVLAHEAWEQGFHDRAEGYFAEYLKGPGDPRLRTEARKGLAAVQKAQAKASATASGADAVDLVVGP